MTASGMFTGVEAPAAVVTTTCAVPVVAPAGRAFHGSWTLIWSLSSAALKDFGTIFTIGAGMLLKLTRTFRKEVESGTVSNCAKFAVKLLPKMVTSEPGAT